MISFLEGIPSTQQEWDARDSRLPVSIPADDDTLLFIQNSLPFVDYMQQDPAPEGPPTVLIPYDTLLRIGSHGYRFRDPRLRNAAALETSLLPASIFAMLARHLRDGFPRDCVFDNWQLFHCALLEHTLAMCQTDKAADYDLSFLDIFMHQRCPVGEGAEWRWLSYMSQEMCCDASDIPVFHDFVHSVGRCFKHNDKVNAGGPFRTIWSSARALLVRYDTLLQMDAGAMDSPTAAGVVMEFLRTSTNHPALGSLDSGPSPHRILMKLKEQAELSHGQAHDKQRVFGNHFQRQLCSKKVSLQRLVEDEDEADPAAAPSYQFTAVFHYEYPCVFQHFAGIPDSFESFLKLSEVAGAVFHGSPTSLYLVDQLLLHHATTLSAPEHIALAPADKVSLIRRRIEAAKALPSLMAPSNTGGSTGAAVVSYNKAALELVQQATLEPSFAIHAARVAAIQRDETDAMWMFKVLLDILVYRTHVEGHDRHPVLSQMVWGQRKLSSQVHAIFPTLVRVREIRDHFLVRYVYFGDCMGVEGAWHMRIFLLAPKFFDRFWKGNWRGIHWWNDFILCFLNAERKIGKEE